LEAGISLPDEAREIIFPQGVPVVRFIGFEAVAHTDYHTVPMPSPPETKERATEAEGGLLNEEKQVALEVAKSGKPIQTESLLQDDTKSAVK
jgi:small conductance mechanosensitive channel